MKDLHTLRPFYRKFHPNPYRCDTCGDRECRRKWRAVCFIHCGKWKPELLPLERIKDNG